MSAVCLSLGCVYFPGMCVPLGVLCVPLGVVGYNAKTC